MGGDALQMVSKLSKQEFEIEKQEELSLSPWRSLPSEIQEHTLAFLSLPDVFRMCVVCKRWNTLIHSSQFQEMCLTSRGVWGLFHAPQLQGWIVRGSPVVPWSSYNLAKRKWISMPNLSFPSHAGHYCWKLLAADGGLLCFKVTLGGVNCFGDRQVILVCNPMTNKWKEIPYVSVDTRALFISHMIVDAQRSSYKILLAGKLPYGRVLTNSVDLYDSVSKTWKAAEALSTNVHFLSGAYCKDKFYILTLHLQTQEHIVSALDLTTLTWRDYPFLVPKALSYPYIVACSGKVYLVGGSPQATHSIPMGSICIFMLVCSKLPRWSKVSEYRNKQLTGALYGCGAIGSKIYVVTSRVTSTYENDIWGFVYDCETEYWEEPFHGGFLKKHIFDIKFNFQPNLQVTHLNPFNQALKPLV